MLPLMPIAYEGGWEYYHAIAFSHREFRRFVAEVESFPAELVILRKSTIDSSIGGSVTVSIADLFARLTSRQVEALLASYSMGYFSFPRKADVLRISAARRVPRTTFQERLTKAENNVVASLVPYLRLLQTQNMA
jgi:predicted DNA binding protein